MHDRTQPPATPPVPHVELPRYEELTLSNGLRVLLVEDRRFPLVTLRMGFEGGSKFDPQGRPGMAEAVSSLLTEGTRKHSSKELAEELAGLGAAINASNSEDAMVVSGNVLAENFNKFLDLVAEVVLEAAFPDDELALYQQNRIQELLAQRGQPSTLANEQMARLVYGTHPYSEIYPTPASIQSLNRHELATFRDRLLAPNRAWLVLFGDLPSKDEVIRAIEQNFGAWTATDGFTEPPADFPAPARQVVLVDRPGSVQCNVLVGRLAIDARDPYFFPFLVGNSILGGGASSRLFMNIREKKGYAYNVGSYLDTQKTGGSFGLYTQVRTEALTAALTDCLAELERMAREPVEATELVNVQNYLTGTFVLRLETQGSLAGQLLAIRLKGLPADYLETYSPSVRAVTREQIQAVAGRYIDPKDSAIVVVGEAKSVGAALETFGPVRIVPAES